MLLNAILALKLTEELPNVEADRIGVDKGALVLAKKGLRMKLAIGDFDSVEEGDLKVIAEYADEVIRLNPIKDDSDSEAAINAAFERGYEKVWLCGALGGRVDHEYVNLKLAMRWPGRVILTDRRNLVTCLAEGVHVIEKGEYPYFSFFPLEEAEVSLEGFFYPLDHRVVKKEDLYTLSNEILSETGTFTIHRGSVLMIQCKD